MMSRRDGGEPVPQPAGTTRPRATQQGAATPGQGATAQGAASAAGNVAESQLDPGRRTAIEHPSSRPFLAFEVPETAGDLDELQASTTCPEVSRSATFSTTTDHNAR